jgi:hypothetical protein
VSPRSPAGHVCLLLVGRVSISAVVRLAGESRLLPGLAQPTLRGGANVTHNTTAWTQGPAGWARLRRIATLARRPAVVAHWGTGEIVAVGPHGNSHAVGHLARRVNAAVPGHGLGWSIDWLPDGRLPGHGQAACARRARPVDGPARRPEQCREHGWNETAVDGRGNVYVNGTRFGFPRWPGAPLRDHRAGHPGLRARQVAGDLAFANGMVVTPYNSTLIVLQRAAHRL